MFQNNQTTKQKGVSLYIAFMVMTILLGIALGVSTLLFSELRILKGMGHSVLAFYATDAGVERALYVDNSVCINEIENNHAPCLNVVFQDMGSVSLSNGARYKLQAEGGGEGNCPADRNYCVRSLGIYKEAQRAVRVAR